MYYTQNEKDVSLWNLCERLVSNRRKSNG